MSPQNIDEVLDQVFGKEERPRPAEDLKHKGRAKGYEPPEGMKYSGTINLSERPVVKFPDGGYGTFYSMSFEENGKEVLVPTIYKDDDGKSRVHTAKEAIQRYRKTGEYLGKYDSPEEADKAADFFHHLSYDNKTGKLNGLWRDDINDVIPFDLKEIEAK